jgi:hypothetical protein
MREVTSDLERNEPMFSVDKRHPRQPCKFGGALVGKRRQREPELRD